MAKLDTETLIDWVEAKLQAQFSAKLTEIAAEKGDSITLEVPATEAYARSLNDAAFNFNLIVLTYESDLAAEGIGPSTSKSISVEIDVILVDDGQDKAIMRKMYRYRRAIEEIFETAWDKLGNGLKIRVTALPAVTLQIGGSKAYHKVVGVILQTEFA